MNIDNIKTLDDILTFMNNNIDYGYIDINGIKHIKELKGFRNIYRTSSIKDTIKNGVGTCIEQVALMNYLCQKLNFKTKMYCTRIYEPDNFDNLEADEHMHCFLLVFKDNKVYHIEHPNWYNIGIFEYENESEAIEKIQEYYIKLSGGITRPLTEFFDVQPLLTFGEFNKYINNLTK